MKAPKNRQRRPVFSGRAVADREVEFVYQKMARDKRYCGEIHTAIGCCKDGTCTKTSPNHPTLTLDSFEEI